MASKRSGRSSQKIAAAEINEESAATEVSTNTTTTTNNGNKGERVMAGLTPDQIQALLGKTRSKGEYLRYLNEFVASGEGGVCANEQWVAIRDKKASTIKQGFVNAQDKKEAAPGAENVKILVNEDLVYLINLAAAGVEVDAEPAAA